jgi:hypothetical protein
VNRWIRWLGMLPASFLAFLVAIQLLRLIHYFGTGVEVTTILGSLIWYVLFPAISHATFTFVGVVVAPNRNWLVGGALIVLSFLIASFQMTDLLIDRGVSPWNLVFVGSALAGAIAGVFLERGRRCLSR